MSFAGSVSAMITSLKNNKIPKRDHKLGHLEYRKPVRIKERLVFKNKMSPEELALFSEQLQARKKRKTIQHITIYLITFSLLIGCIYYFLV